MGSRGARRHRASRYQLFLFQIDAKVHAFEGMPAQQGHVTRLGEDHVVAGSGAGRVDDRVPDLPSNHATIGRDELFEALGSDPQIPQHFSRDPSVLASGIHHRLGQVADLAAARMRLDAEVVLRIPMSLIIAPRGPGRSII